MPKNLFQRIVTSFFLLSIFLFTIFTNQYIFILSILILGLIICFEANNIFLKLILSKISKQKSITKGLNIRFLLSNLITFCYVFFIFCLYSYKIYLIEGQLFFFFVCSICFSTDIGGYLFGKIIGGKKLTKISPNKTVSGSIGSFICCLFPLLIFQNLDLINYKFNINSIMFCLLVSLISQLGDLFISFLKRKAKIKDTGKILPGHGGMLDRVDGIIFAIPFSYFLIKLI